MPDFFCSMHKIFHKLGRSYINIIIVEGHIDGNKLVEEVGITQESVILHQILNIQG